jgi:hypothetical protein
LTNRRFVFSKAAVAIDRLIQSWFKWYRSGLAASGAGYFTAHALATQTITSELLTPILSASRAPLRFVCVPFFLVELLLLFSEHEVAATFRAFQLFIRHVSFSPFESLVSGPKNLYAGKLLYPDITVKKIINYFYRP